MLHVGPRGPDLGLHLVEITFGSRRSRVWSNPGLNPGTTSSGLCHSVERVSLSEPQVLSWDKARYMEGSMRGKEEGPEAELEACPLHSEPQYLHLESESRKPKRSHVEGS